MSKSWLRTPNENPSSQDLGELFAYVNIKGMVPRDPQETSVQAAIAVAKACKTKLHKEIMWAFEVNGPMTDEELEELPQFAHYGPTTVSKRRTELYQAGYLVDTGLKRPNHRGFMMKVWGLP